MNIFDIQGLLDNTATILTKIEVLPKVAGESIITLTNEDSIKKWVYNDFRFVPKEGFIGQFVARTLDGELQDISDDFDIEDREIVLYLGINSNHIAEITTQTSINISTQSNEDLITELGEYETTYYKLGNFFIEKPSSDNVKDSTKFQSQDYTMLFNVKFNPDFKNSTYTKSFNERLNDNENVTALWVAQYTCAQVGVTLGTTTFRNSTFRITSNQFDSDFTCRDVIKAIAKLAFTWARIGWDNKLYLDFNKQTTTEEYNVVTNDNYYGLVTQKEVYGEVNRILTGSSIVTGNSAYIENAQSITDNGLTELDVYDNPILYTQELREQAITGAQPLMGLIYQPVEFETTGHPWLLGNELIRIVDMEGNDLYTYPFDRTLTYNGHIRSKISSITKTDVQSNYSYKGVNNNEEEIKRSKVELDRQNQTLTSVMERTSTNETNISTMRQDINGINTSVTSIRTDVGSLQGDVTGINSDISDINGKLVDVDSDIDDIVGDIADLNTNLNGLSVDFNDFVDNEYVQTIQDLQNQIDGVIEFWTGSVVPTLNNYPANQWTTEEDRQNHNGDVYTVVSGSTQGASYRFVKDGSTWKWIEISDSEIGAVRELAQSAMDKANANADDILALQRADVTLQANIDGVSASYRTLDTKVNTIDNDLDELEAGYNNLTTAEKTATGSSITINDCGEYPIKKFAIYGTSTGVTGEHTLSIRRQSETVAQGQQYTYDLDEINLVASGAYRDYIYYNEFEDNWYYIVDRSNTHRETLIEDENLVISLNNILDNAKLYQATMIITDTANESGSSAQIEINYLTDMVFNAVYATRSDINVTKHAITSSVSETIVAEVSPLNTRIDDVSETLEQNTKDITDSINAINGNLSQYAKESSLVTINNRVDTIQTAVNQQIAVTQDIQENGVSKVTTTTGFTFDKDGLSVSKTGADTKTLIDEDGMTVYSTTGSTDSELLNVDSQGVQTENIHIRTFTQIGSHTRMQDYEDGTAIFYIE